MLLAETSLSDAESKLMELDSVLMNVVSPPTRPLQESEHDRLGENVTESRRQVHLPVSGNKASITEMCHPVAHNIAHEVVLVEDDIHYRVFKLICDELLLIAEVQSRIQKHSQQRPKETAIGLYYQVVNELLTVLMGNIVVVTRLGQCLLEMGSDVLMDLSLGDLEDLAVIKTVNSSRESDDTTNCALGADHSLVKAIHQENEGSSYSLMCMESSMQSTPESCLELGWVGGLGVGFKGLHEVSIEFNIAYTTLKQLEDEALHASKRCRFIGRVAREVVGKDSVGFVVQRTRKSLLNPLGEDTLTNTSLAPYVEQLLLTAEEAGQLAGDPATGGLKALADRLEADGKGLVAKTVSPHTVAEIILGFPDAVDVLAKCCVKADGDGAARSEATNLLLVVACDAADEVHELAEDMGSCLFDGRWHVFEVSDARNCG
ncbi:hypothetical protein HG530_013907 [Fusarium avenaceum]|nr:hypothetical protein HG530_013907 [Fusarium avenaceum]